jgi:hypothetical protein
MNTAPDIPALANYIPAAQFVLALADMFAGRDAWWQWYAIDADGRGHFFEKEPSVEGERWGWDGGSMFGWKHDMIGTDWQTCIYCRPIEPTECDKEAFAGGERIAQAIGAAT